MISREMLRAHPFSVQTWDAQSSGTVIKPIAEGALEKRWAELTGKRKAPKLDTPVSPARSSKVSAHAAAAAKSAAGTNQPARKPKEADKRTIQSETTINASRTPNEQDNDETRHNELDARAASPAPRPDQFMLTPVQFPHLFQHRANRP